MVDNNRTLVTTVRITIKINIKGEYTLCEGVLEQIEKQKNQCPEMISVNA